MRIIYSPEACDEAKYDHNPPKNINIGSVREPWLLCCVRKPCCDRRAGWGGERDRLRG